MTREEIKNIVRHVFHFYDANADNYSWTDMNEACGEIIKALEQQPCEDAISRADLIEKYEERFIELQKAHQMDKQLGINWCINTLKEMPPVTPTRKKGKWEKYGIPRAGEQHYQCTNCKNYVNFGMWGSYYKRDFKYCPHCGAEMDGERQ